MTRRRNTDCVLAVCDGSGWIDLTEDPDTEQERCPCGRAVEPPADLHDRIMFDPGAYGRLEDQQLADRFGEPRRYS